MTVSQRLKDAIKAKGQTFYQIAKGARVDWGTLNRFMDGRRPNIRIDSVDRLCAYLGLELQPKKQRAKKKKTAGKQAGKK